MPRDAARSCAVLASSRVGAAHTRATTDASREAAGPRCCGEAVAKRLARQGGGRTRLGRLPRGGPSSGAGAGLACRCRGRRARGRCTGSLPRRGHGARIRRTDSGETQRLGRGSDPAAALRQRLCLVRATSEPPPCIVHPLELPRARVHEAGAATMVRAAETASSG